jgi:hypothetical protein
VKGCVYVLGFVYTVHCQSCGGCELSVFFIFVVLQARGATENSLFISYGGEIPSLYLGLVVYLFNGVKSLAVTCMRDIVIDSTVAQCCVCLL